tara:strand:+ start:449 stop:919 length:471 start_codon:yes stop_codon:yes gene_type:complete
MYTIPLDMTDRNSYLNFIGDCRSEIKASREEKFSLSLELKRALNSFNGVTVVPVDWGDLDSHPLNEWVQLNERVEIIKRFSSENLLVFDTIMVAGGNFGWHSHGDCVEEFEVVSGVLKDLDTKTVYGAKDVVIFDMGVEHTPVAIEDCVLSIKFKR